MKHYWINIDKRTDRREYAEKIFKDYNIDNERICAVTPETLKDYNINYYDNEVRMKQEYACIISHINAIKKGYEDGNEYFCVTEDDFVLQKPLDFNKIFQHMKKAEEENNEKIEILQLHINQVNNIAKLYNNLMSNGKFIIKRTLPEYEEAWCTTYYLISREGAKKILDTVLINDTVDLKKYNRFCVADDLLYYIANTYMITYPLIIANIKLESSMSDKYLYLIEYGINISKEIWEKNNLLHFFT